ncbi:LamG domain-containing protein [Maribacter sp. MMG018]|uniref:LamG-like jellyroll fold domain-containing protein n=1 Tax=Maribacter sp. MMG018 TaxID=2822688 RepID=UPI001B3770ED|nr:LamG-like jellyroll fold domain-containing protein [Maribacter sp. MMG018]MBQ4914634.1 LamG domain-containing protein [Maribacter sp. MMG018]
MRNTIKSLLFVLGLLVVSCDDGIDPLTYVAPGEDAEAPQITINSPADGMEIKVFEDVTTLDVSLEVTDDIEIKDIVVLLDGNEIASFNSFLDYRRAIEEFTYDSLGDGSHTLTVTATDLDGKTSTSSVDFSKAPPYTPLFDGESFYMAFDGDYRDQIGFELATEVGTPGFENPGHDGVGAYSGATDSYLTFPSEGLLSNEFSASFWYKVDADPDRAGILVVGDDADDRLQGFRLFREASGDDQRIKLNVGTGAGESWNDGDLIDPSSDEWVHITITISSTKNTIYFNGVEVNSSDMSAPIDWTGCEEFTIGSGGPTYDYWGHGADNSAIDELRFYTKALSAEEVVTIYGGELEEEYFGATLYMPFDGANTDMVNGIDPTLVGTASFAGESKVGTNAYAGATDSYLTLPITGLFTNEFSGAFWYKVNADADRAGILTVAPPMIGADNDLSAGFRLFREGDANEQRIKLHVGAVEDNVWNDGDVIDVTAGEWVHIAFTVSETETKIYFNGTAVANVGDMTGKTMNWENCSILSIGSGAPNFIGWSHLSDTSYIDELYLFDRVLTADEIQDLME